MASEAEAKKRLMDSTPPSGKSVRDWDVVEDKKFDGHRYIANPQKWFFNSLEKALQKKGLI